MARLRRSSRLQSKRADPYKVALQARQSNSHDAANKIHAPTESAVDRPSSQSSNHNGTRKRKRVPGELTEKSRSRKRKIAAIEQAQEGFFFDEHSSWKAIDKEQAKEPQVEDPVEHWASHGLWPPGYATMENSRSNSHDKRQRSSSYSASVRKGEAPPAHSPAAVNGMRDYGINLEVAPANRRISKESKTLYNGMLSQPCNYTPSMAYPISKFVSVWNRISCRNEARIVRDLSPLLLPSPENLVFSGIIKSESIAEEVGAEWKRVKPMGGPKPRSDLTVGLSQNAFTEVELEKLKNHDNPEQPAKFTDWVYFPFLACEVKCSAGNINEADRQSGHAGGIAANAIYQLYASLSHRKAKSLNGQILVFSMAHDHKRAEIYGVYSYVGRAKSPPVFHRHPILSIELDPENTERVKQFRDFIIQVYTSFYSTHLKRIQDALREMPSPKVMPTNVDNLMLPPPSRGSSLQQTIDDQAKQIENQSRLIKESTEAQLKMLEEFKVQAEAHRAEREAHRAEREAHRAETEAQRQAHRAETEAQRQAQRAETQELKEVIRMLKKQQNETGSRI